MANFKLTLEEQETIINYNAGEKKVYISTAFQPDIDYYDGLCKSNPDWIKKTHSRDPYQEYEINDKRYSAVRLRPPRKLSEEESAKIAERLQKGRASKTSGNVGK